jgi:RimJ/RimL family protein N-acetyltransferase
VTSATRVRLRPKRIEDARNDYNWQTDTELSDLDAVPPLKMAFADYVEDYKDQLRHPSPIRRPLAIETLSGTHIGNCVYYNIDRIKREAEVGIMIGDRNYWNQGLGTEAMNELVDYVFRRHNFRRLYLKTLEKNIRAQHSFTKAGFTPCGNMERDGYRFLLMELPRSRWKETRAALQKRRGLLRL